MMENQCASLLGDHEWCLFCCFYFAAFLLSSISIFAINAAFTVTSGVPLYVDRSCKLPVERTVWLARELLLGFDDIILNFFVGGNGMRIGTDRFLGEANFFPNVKDGNLVASPSGK